MTTTMVKKPEWIEKLPNGWAFLPVRAVLKERKEKNTKLEESNILSVMKGIGVIRYEDKGNVGNKSSERPEAYKIVRKNDLVLNSMNLSIGSVGMAREDGVTSSVYIIYQARPKVADPNFYHYLFQTTSFQRHLASYGRGIMELREAVKERDIKNQPIVVPSLETQKRIAEFLDEKTEVIDELVAKKEKLIELLREKRAALITRAVTKGLDPNAKLKASGVEWLGNVPNDWDKMKLSRLFVKIGSGTTPDSVYLTEDESGIPWINTGDLNDSFMRMPVKKVRPEALRAYSTLKLYSKNSIVMAMYGATIGKLGIPTFDFCTNQACCVLENPLEIVFQKFIYYWLLGNKKEIIELGVGGGQPNINKEIIRSLEVFLPDIEQQEKIASFLDIEVEKINSIINPIESQIEKLKEYRSSLIYSAVTGKLKI